jgi:hypothetical protein
MFMVVSYENNFTDRVYSNPFIGMYIALNPLSRFNLLGFGIGFWLISLKIYVRRRFFGSGIVFEEHTHFYNGIL